MAAKKRVSRPRKSRSKAQPRATMTFASQVGRLTATVQGLRTKLMDEARRRKLDQRLLTEAARARSKVVKQMSALRAQGARLASQLKRVTRDAEAREQARRAALAKMAELREELRRKREEVRRTSTELAKLARESAARAREIVQTGGLSAESGESTPAGPQDGPPSQKPPT